MKTPMIDRLNSTLRPSLLVIAVLLPLGACSKADPGTPPSVAANGVGSSTTTSTNAVGTTETTKGDKTTTTTKEEDETTTTTARRGGPTTTAAPTDSTEIQAELRDTYGVTFTADQGACLGDGFSVNPELLKVLSKGYTPSLDMSAQVIEIYARCLGGVPAAAHAIVETLVKQGQLTATEAKCVEPFLGELSQGDLAKFFSNDSATVSRVMPKLEHCGPSGGTA